MPFKKQGKDDYTGPSGKHFNLNQVRLYYANGGSFPSHANGGQVMSYAKGGAPKTASYAEGGPVLGRVREFLKEPDQFRAQYHEDPGAGKDKLYGKSGPGKGDGEKGAPEAKGKSLAAVKPRS